MGVVPRRSLGCCAGGGTRTLTLFRALAPKASMSANSITPADVTMVPVGVVAGVIAVVINQLTHGTVVVCL